MMAQVAVRLDTATPSVVIRELKLTFLENLGPVDLDQAGVGILVLLPVAHGGQNNEGCAGGVTGASCVAVVRTCAGSEQLWPKSNSRRCQFNISLGRSRNWGLVPLSAWG